MTKINVLAIWCFIFYGHYFLTTCSLADWGNLSLIYTHVIFPLNVIVHIILCPHHSVSFYYPYWVNIDSLVAFIDQGLLHALKIKPTISIYTIVFYIMGLFFIQWDKSPKPADANSQSKSMDTFKK